MKQYFLFLLLTGWALTGCQDTLYQIPIPETGITLTQPDDRTVIDLNHFLEYTFGWDKGDQEGDFVIMFSSSPYLLPDNPLEGPDLVPVGDADSYTMNYNEFDQRMAVLGMKAGSTRTLYWAVKPQSDNYLMLPAASEIRSFSITRLASKLSAPEDRFRLALSTDNPDSTCTFQWDNTGHTAALSIVFSADPSFASGEASFPAGTGTRQVALKHSQLQTLINTLNIDPFKMNRLYWNVRNQSTGQFVSLASSTLLLDGMMILTDIRGGESITYRVTKITYSDGEEVVWLAENLRATNYPDGTPIGDQMTWAPNAWGPSLSKAFSQDEIDAFGGHYHFDVRMQVVPTGWHLPTREELEKLCREALLAPGGYNVLLDPVLFTFAIKEQDGHVNDWKMNFVPAGRYLYSSNPIYYVREDPAVALVLQYANPKTTDGSTEVDVNKTIMFHVPAGQFFFNPESPFATIRAVYGN
jgi:uncharacterized protein (TIGR02145 family)